LVGRQDGAEVWEQEVRIADAATGESRIIRQGQRELWRSMVN
jgi:hypothetical protein